jgi:mono/diheme cytochrome c family protein
MRRCWVVSFGLGSLLLLAAPALAGEPTATERGRDALLGRSFSPPLVGRAGYEGAWKQWGVKEKPGDYAAAFIERYGLHPAPYENNGLPMGLREAKALFSKGVGTDCMLCHGGSICGKSYVGMPNTALDLEGMFEELAAADGLPVEMPYRFSNVRGTVEAVAATTFLMSLRDTDLKVRDQLDFGPPPDQLCEDVPAWWLLKKKKTMYATGQVETGCVRTLMAFMLSPLVTGEAIKKQEPTFRDVREYLLSLEPPKYPFAIDEKLAATGKEVFENTCSRCHGTYGKDWTYPNKIVDLDVVGTDRSVADAATGPAAEHFARSWFGQEKKADGSSYFSTKHDGYQAPPLDGIWATAPYFHNGSAPTLADVLDSKHRPKVFTRSYGTGEKDYDPVKVGWKVTVLEKGPDQKAPARERRRVYDTTQPGRGNDGHRFGDKLSDEERRAVIEYLKTL